MRDARSARRATRDDATPVARHAADGLSFAAAPSFAVIALLTHASGGDGLCTATPGSSLGGMATMYAVMSLFHLAPWLKLMSRRSVA